MSSEYTYPRASAVQMYGLGRSDKELAKEFGVSRHTIRRWASLDGVKRGSLIPGAEEVAEWGRQFEAAAIKEEDPEEWRQRALETGTLRTNTERVVKFRGGYGINYSEEPPGFTRRCRNKHCINRFVPVNTQHSYCSPECRTAPEAWTLEEILQEEGSLTPDAHPLEMAKRAFGQKNQALRKVVALTSNRDYFRYEFASLLEENPHYRLDPKPHVLAPDGERSDREIILICSDWQVGKLERGVGVEVVQQRVSRIIEAVIQIKWHFEAAGHPVPRIRIVFAGDMLEGCFIYGGQNVSGLDRTGNSHRIVRQIYTTADLEAQLVVNIAAHFSNVHVMSVPGNHGRPNGKNDFADPEDNFDTMIAWWAKDKAANQDNVEWQIEEDWWGTFTSLGHPVVAIHGDQWRGKFEELNKLLPSWVLADIFGVRPHLFISAHRHEFHATPINGVWAVQNGTIDGGSEWFTKSAGKASKPEQTVVVMSRARGVEAIYPLYFDEAA